MKTTPSLLAGVVLAASLVPAALLADDGRKIQVLTTTSDLREIARAVGGDAVEVQSLARGPEDPHFIDARPSFVRQAHDADLFVKIGMELEIGYEGPIVRDARNPRIQPGMPGYCDASVNVDKLGIPTGTVDRSRGDVHGEGNPHFLLDPVRAKVVASTIADSLAKVDPPRADAYRARAAGLAKRLDEAMFGEKVLVRAPARRLERLLSEGKLAGWLKEKGWEGELGGWAKLMLPFAGAKVASYHAYYSYLEDRFHLEDVAHLEPKPGVPPSPRHVKQVMEAIRAQGVRALLVNVYQPKDVSEAVARDTGVKVVTIAHMPGAFPGTDDYLACVDANVRALAAALGAGE